MSIARPPHIGSRRGCGTAHEYAIFVLARLNQEIGRVFQRQAVGERLRSVGAKAVGGSSEQLALASKDEIARMGKVYRKNDIG
jgi:hypothetical protein